MAHTPDLDSLRTTSIVNPSSSREHDTVPSCEFEACGLLSLDQLHHATPVQDQDATTIVDHEDEREPHFPPISSTPNSIREASDVEPTPPCRTIHWKTVGMIIGFLFAALLSALGHYLLVRNLDGKLADTAYLTQSQASAVAILLTTIFKAALTASLGICFTQHLWLVLRGNPMPLAAIEKLFIFRTNILLLGDLRSIWRAPLLFLMALLIWCLGLATIYPPGALIVTFEVFNYTESRNISVMNPPVPEDLNLGSNDTLTGMGFNTYPGELENGSVGLIWSYGGPTNALRNIAKSVIINNQVFNLPVHSGENSTYNLQFRGPQLQCTSPAPFNNTSPLYYDSPLEVGDEHWLATPVFVSTWDQHSRWEPDSRDAPLYSIAKHEPLAFTKRQTSENVTSFEIFRSTAETICNPQSVHYDVKVSFLRGIQTVQHTISDAKPLSPMTDYSGIPSDLLKQYGLIAGQLGFPLDAQRLQDSNQRMRNLVPLSTEWVLLDALGILLEDKFYSHSMSDFSREADNPCGKESSNWTNDTTYIACGPWEEDWESANMNASTPLAGTVFDASRSMLYPHSLDPRVNLNITEDLLNNVLTNLTISAISLGTWWDMVNVTTTQYQSTYSFANPLNLILPYSLCLAAATLFAAIAIWSLSRNGEPAADGGFLQIMMATRGNTEMERLVLRERLTTTENMSKELKSLQIRYGELVDEDVLGVEGRRMGFGTLEETVSLRKQM